MDTDVLSAVISGAAGMIGALAGALVGFAGAQRTNKRTIEQSREQRRFERAREMRAEVIPRLFVRLRDLDAAFDYVLNTPHRALKMLTVTLSQRAEGRLGEEQFNEQIKEWEQEAKRQLNEFLKRFDELSEYFGLYRIWVPDELSSTMSELTDKYNKEFRRVEKAIEEWRARPVPQVSDLADLEEALNHDIELYESSVRETRDWFDGERRRRETAMWSAARRVLGVEE